MIQNADKLEFISKPSPTARVNTPYLYTAKAISRDSMAVIRYSGHYTNMMSMTPALRPFPIDSVTGVVNWTPTAKGWYAIVLLAVSNKGGHDRQEFTVLVSSGSGNIQGRVTDTLNTGIPNIIVRAFKTDISPMTEIEDHDGGFFTYSARTDSNGYYTIRSVQPGSYKLRAIAPTPDYASQWYDGQTDVALANVVTVADSAATTVDFVLRAKIKKVAVSGSVTDTLGAALHLPSRVFFVRAGFLLNSNTSLDDFRESLDDDHESDFKMDGGSRNVFSTKVDTLGDYSLRIPTGSYIAFARATGYVTTFFQNQTDFTSADIIVLQADSANINFRMTALPPIVLGSISGTVSDSSKGTGVRARVIAFRDHWRDRDDYRVARTYTTDTDSTGAYTLSQLVPGKYIVFAAPVGYYAPAYYTTDTSSTRWKRATVLAVNGNTFGGINIYVGALPASLQGYTGIKGSVNASDRSVVAGAFIYAMAGGQVSGYGMTGGDGSYSINGLAPGTYSVSIDRPGFDEVSSQIATVSYSNTSSSSGLVSSSVPVIQTINFSVSGTATGVTPSSGIVVSYRLGQNYPNPFNPSTTISYQVPEDGLNVKIEIYNIMGQLVHTLVDAPHRAGEYKVVWDGRNDYAQYVSSGIYLFRMASSNFVSVRKMLYVK
jgi:hypothetical protein